MDEQLPYLDTFVRVADCNSFTVAAGQLGLTQAAVSQRIQALEKALDTSLFHRRKGRIEISASGESLYKFAQKILQLHRDAIANITGQRSTSAVELMLSCSSIPGQHILPELLTSFRQAHADVRVRASITDSQSVLEEMEKGKTHLGIVGMRADSPNLQFESLTKDELVVLVPTNHCLAARKSVDVKEILKHPFVVREPGSGSRRCLEEALQRLHYEMADLNVALELGNNEAIKQAVLQGVGITVLSGRSAERELKSGELVRLNVRKLTLAREIFFVTAVGRILPTAAQLFREFALSHCS